MALDAGGPRHATTRAASELVVEDPSAPIARPRDPYVDNLKAVLILFVVVGHMLEKVAYHAPGAPLVYTWIYLFHMPAFAVVSGMLTSSAALTVARARTMLRTLIVPLIIFQLLLMLLYSHFGKLDGWTVMTFLTPLYQLWFLGALFAWRASAPLVRRVPAPIVVAVVICLGVGLLDGVGRFLTLARILMYLPFFVAGVVIGRDGFRMRPSQRARGLAVALLVASAPLAVFVHRHLDTAWLYWDRGYREVHSGPVAGIAIRAGLLAVGAVLTWCVFVLVPRRPWFGTRIGEHSMYPYVWHSFVTLSLGWWLLHDRIDAVWQMVALIGVALALAYVLSSAPVRRLTRPLVEGFASRR